MRRNLWIRAVLLAAVGAAAAAPPPPDARAADAVPSTDGYRTALLATDTSPGARDEAARRLAAGGAAGDVDALRVALSRGGPAAQAAAARAVAGTPDPNAAWAGPLIALLGPNRAVTEAAATALGRYAATPQADPAFDALRRFSTGSAVSPFTRAAAVRPMGAFDTQQAAGSLVSLLDDRNQTIQQAAVNGLLDMTGEADRGTLTASWRAWWGIHRGDSPAVWQAYVSAVRTREAGLARVRQNVLAADLRQVLEGDYYSLPTAARQDRLGAYLRAGLPEIRSEGAKLALAEVGNRPVSDAVMPRVRELIADEDPAVRLAAVAAVQGASDQQAGPALVAQLGRERDAAIRIKLTQALDKLQDLDAARPLIKLLDDPRPAVGTAAARALRGIGQQLRQQRPVDAADVVTTLERILANRPAPGPGADEFRAACVDALAVLADSQRAFQTLRGMLNATPQEPRDVRVAVLNGFGTLGDTKADAIVANALNDADEPTIRYAAARALLTVGTEQQAEQLFRLSQQEPDPSVRDAAWQSLAHLLERGTADFLQDWVKRFPDDPVRRLVVRQDYGRALQAAGQADGVAANNQEVADLLLKLNRPDEAIGPLQTAIDYYQKKAPPGGGDLENLVEQMLTAQLKAHRYAAATDFASREIRQYASYQPTAGRAFREAAEELRASGDTANLDALINAAAAIQPPLEAMFIDNLKAVREDARSSPQRR